MNKTAKVLRYGGLLLVFLALFATQSSAVPPPPGFVKTIRPTCKVNPVAMKRRAAALKAAPFFPVPLSPTTAYVAVIRIDFSDKAMTKTITETESFFNDMKEYYLENSYGLMTVNATVTNTSGAGAGIQGAYRLSLTLASYAQGICSNYDQIAKEAVSRAESDGFDFSNGAFGGRPFDHIMIYHAGIGAETANDSGCQTDNIWSVFAPTVPATSAQTEGVLSPFLADGVAFNGTTIVPESEAQGIDPLGVICHEYGHQLGLPDLYSTPSSSVVGLWTLMDSGVFTGSPLGSNPSHLDAWSKQFLGFFSNPQTVTVNDSAQSIDLNLALSSSSAFLRIPISGVAGVDGSKEYFLVERRAGSSRTGRTYDNALPLGTLGEGYLILHVDDDIAGNATRLEENTVNVGIPHFGVDVVEAAGQGKIAATSGKDSDLFPGSGGKSLFATPLSNTFGGQQTGIAVSGFLTNSLVAKRAFASSTVEIAKVINFPNPGGPSFTQKSGAPATTVTTIVLNITKPPQKSELTIHDMRGALVRDVPEWEIKANANATSSNKFVFEYNWDGRDDGGKSVAPGVYFYRFKADDKAVKTGKLVLIK